MVFLYLHPVDLGTFSFFLLFVCLFLIDWKYVILNYCNEIKYIRNVRISSPFGMFFFLISRELAMWMRLPCMMCVYIPAISSVFLIRKYFLYTFLPEQRTPRPSQVTQKKTFFLTLWSEFLYSGCIFFFLCVYSRLKGYTHFFYTFLFYKYLTDVMYTCHIVMYLS